MMFRRKDHCDENIKQLFFADNVFGLIYEPQRAYVVVFSVLVRVTGVFCACFTIIEASSEYVFITSMFEHFCVREIKLRS